MIPVPGQWEGVGQIPENGFSIFPFPLCTASSGLPVPA
jgi:hypothetical protein